jgi:hypothetical protein
MSFAAARKPATFPKRPIIHVFKIGQAVKLMRGFGHHPQNTNLYRVVGALPPLGASFQYRIRSDHERHERIALEDDLEAVRMPATSKASAQVAAVFGAE